MSEAAMWSDDELAVLQHINDDRDDREPIDEKFAELYRLCRLGLAAEQVGRDVLCAAETFEERADEAHQPLLRAFLNHPAWRDK